MKNLPIGIQTLTELRSFNGIYVDKTKYVHELVTTGKYYFFARPRRFGKSLLVSTLKELFKGNKGVFEGLWIKPHWDWTQTHPVIHISFDAVSYQSMSLEEGLSIELDQCAARFGIELKTKGFKLRFRELLESVAAQHDRIVLLIDEYDKPIIDYLETDSIEQARVNQAILREFYAVLKNADEQLRLVFITGISKFSKVSLFSHLNNLSDITLNKKYATLTGYTQEEIEFYFEDYLKIVEQNLSLSRIELLEQMKVWYNGYSWDGVTKVYNPFGTLNFFDNQEFRNFWFSTGNPKFLIDQMRKQQHFNVENWMVDSTTFEKFDIENLSLVSLLFQTGYLTIKERDVHTGSMTLDYPNKEVRESMYQFLLDDLATNAYRSDTGRTVRELKKAFLDKNIDQVRHILNAILADLPSEVYLHQSEGLYHGLVHVIFSYLGMFVSSEVHSSQGRADAVVETATDIFIFEFKFSDSRHKKTAAEAMAQIKAKKYGDKYQTSNKTLTAIAFNFDATTRCIDEWMVEEISTH
jgi:Predicted AAA-ATPase/PD-(D/E)XK nuclease superfamily